MSGPADDPRDAHGRVRAVFDDWAERGRAEGMERGHAFAAREGFARLGLAAGGRYLDVGCGTGYTVRWASEAVGPAGRAVGLDLSPRMVERARAAGAPHDNVEFHLAAFPAHGLGPQRFDGIFSMEVLYYLPDADAALCEVYALLAPGGRFACVLDFYRENPDSHGWPDELGVAMDLRSMAGWRAAFEAAGLEVVEQACLLHPLAPGDAPGWKHTQGSLLTLGRRL